MEFIFAVLLLVATIFLGICVLLLKYIADKPMPQVQREVIVPAISQFDPESQVTTILPLPLEAHTCSHDWDKVADEKLEMPHEQKLVVILKCAKCGVIDKTVQVTSKIPPPPKPPDPPPLPRSECSHNWEKEKSITLESAYEQMAKSYRNGQWQKNDKKPDLDLGNIRSWMFRKTFVCVRVCGKCGEIDKVIASNIEGEDLEEVESNG